MNTRSMHIDVYLYSFICHPIIKLISSRVPVCVCVCVCFVSMISCICTYHGKLICLTQTTVPEDRFFNGFTALSARGFTVPRATSSTLFVGSSQTFCGARSVRRLCSLWEALSSGGSSLIVGVSSPCLLDLRSCKVTLYSCEAGKEGNKKSLRGLRLSDMRVAHFHLRHDSCCNAKSNAHTHTRQRLWPPSSRSSLRAHPFSNRGSPMTGYGKFLA